MPFGCVSFGGSALVVVLRICLCPAGGKEGSVPLRSWLFDDQNRREEPDVRVCAGACWEPVRGVQEGRGGDGGGGGGAGGGGRGRGRGGAAAAAAGAPGCADGAGGAAGGGDRAGRGRPDAGGTRSWPEPGHGAGEGEGAPDRLPQRPAGRTECAPAG